jgi:hypothetical protein
MGKNDTIYDKIQEILGEIPGNLSVQQQQIDVEVQMAYYRMAETLEKELDAKRVMNEKELLFSDGVNQEKKKRLLTQLANIATIESYRTLEKYVSTADRELHDWALLAIQENKLMLESNLLDENKILISTGLGGRGMKLRYFVALITRNGMKFSPFEKKLIQSELRYHMNQCHAEIESVRFDQELCRVVSVIPLNVSIHHLFDQFILECNIFGDFLNSDFLITNVRILTVRQIRSLIRPEKKKKPGYSH